MMAGHDRGRGISRWYGFFLVCGCLLYAGCMAGETTQQGQGGSPPLWLTKIPQESGNLCAMGISGPTYYAEDAVINSKTQALSELARSLRSSVKSELLVQQQGGSTGVDHVQVQDAVALSSNEILELAQVRNRWTNPGGFQTQGAKGTVYTLMCLPVN